MEVKKRKDQWLQQDDDRLAQIVLQAVSEGRSQLAGFQEAAEVLGRTKQACGFRWNKTLRKIYEKDLENAKSQPKQMMRTHLKQALTSFDQLSEAYYELKDEYDQLQQNYLELIHWIETGTQFLKKDISE
ncbi:transcriptional regulator [Rummeliibacillus sp. SL167]|uniref:transcriptional regulator n=1 Tax=Rummeliibacillus sp. SL167 TaxID=2579792 RepID=UPI0011B72CAC|nr:transcriptional regulator [Rummeliibacillus sp. SL167]